MSQDSKERFGARAGDYARARPSYPIEIIDSILDGFGQPTVADLGAGTGIASLLLSRRNAHVIAVEPNERMRAEIPRGQDIALCEGSAERTSLPDASVDIVTAFQSYHWFDVPAFYKELDRIAKPRSRFAAVWNHRDRNDTFTGAYEAIIDAYDESDRAVDTDRRKGVDDDDLIAADWSDIGLIEAAHEKRYDWNLMLAYLRSVSYVPQSGEMYEAMVDEMRALFDRAAQGGAVTFRYIARAQLAERYP